MIVFSLLKILCGLLLILLGIAGVISLFAVQGILDGPGALLVFMACGLCVALGCGCLGSTEKRWTSFQWVTRLMKRSQDKACAAGRHLWEEKERFPVSWCVGQVYRVCAHCKAEEYLGTRIHYD